MEALSQFYQTMSFDAFVESLVPVMTLSVGTLAEARLIDSANLNNFGLTSPCHAKIKEEKENNGLFE